jgi:polyketide synthase PksN
MNIHEYIYNKLSEGAIPEGAAIDLLCHLDGLHEPERRDEFGGAAASDSSAIESGQFLAAQLIVEGEVKQEAEHWLFAEEWLECALERVATRVLTVVALLSDRGNQSALATTLERLNANVKVVFVEQTAEWELQSDRGAHRYAVRRDSLESYSTAFREIRREHGEIHAVWYAWGLEDASCIEDHGPIIYLLQGLGTSESGTKVWLIGEYRSALERCYLDSWIGYARSLEHVMPGVRLAVVQAERMRGVSAESSIGSVRMEQWTRRLWDELLAKRMESSLYMGERRHVLRIQKIELAAEGKRGALRYGGTYLVTGGLGELGYLFAEYLAKRYAANLVLTGRSSINEERRSRLKALEDLGGKALYVRADVSDIEQMRGALQQGREQFGELHGAIHTAGIEGGASVLISDMQSVGAVLAPKIRGTLVLSELLNAQESVEFICYFSSLSAVLGDFGSCAYSVGNRFELAYAQYAESRALAIGWPLWVDGGMGFKDDAARHLYLKTSGQRALGSAEGIGLFELLLEQHRDGKLTHALTIVGASDRIHGLVDLLAPASGIEATMRAESARRPELQRLTLAECVLYELTELTCELLKLPPGRLDEGENLADYGFDSILLVQFATRISAQYGIEVLPSLFFSHSTLRKLADYFMTQHAAVVQRLYGNEETVKHVSAARVAAAGPIGSEALRRRASSATSWLHVSGEQRQVAAPAAMCEPIAIVGMSGRFPEARSIDELWQILAEGRDAVQEIPLERFDWREYYAEPSDAQDGASLAGKITSKWLGVMPGLDEFEPLFFEISPKEAQLMDPRQRLLLQESFKALEDAGYGASQLRAHKIGMFVGAEQGDYQSLAGTKGSITSNHDALLAARLSYFLDLHGPVIAINTACSSGLVAVHQACLSLRAGECATAIAASANAIVTPLGYIGMSRAGMLSPDGKCYAFDRRANGMVPGEAIAVVVLKRLSQAEADGDLIYAVIRGSGINCDGKTNGLTAPSGAAQAELIKEVYARAGIDRRDIEYIVTHGTGTRLGDPVEIDALQEVFKDVQGEGSFCALTSIKTNIGHTFAASGLVNLISLVQALRHETIPASLHCGQLSDYVDWKKGPLYVNVRPRAWPRRPDKERIGAVSSFGMSGTNAHLVVGSYDATKHSAATLVSASGAPCYLLALSAKTASALQQRVLDLIAVLRGTRGAWDKGALASLSYTLLHHRQHFTCRCALVIEGDEQGISLLEELAGGDKHVAVPAGKVATGQVTKRPGADTLIARHGDSLIELLREGSLGAEEHREKLCALADLYCQGYDLAWGSLFADVPRQMRLPTYSFAREKHWVRPVAVRKNGAARLGEMEQSNMKDTWALEKGIDAGCGAAPPSPRKIQLSSVGLEPVAQAPGIALGDEVHEISTGHPLTAERALPFRGSGADAAGEGRESIANAPGHANLESTRKNIGRLLAEALYLEHPVLDYDKSFAELGVDSIIGVEFVQVLARCYHIDVAATVLYECPTVKELAAMVCEKVADRANAVGGGVFDRQGGEPKHAAGVKSVQEPPTILSAVESGHNSRLPADSADRFTNRRATRPPDGQVAVVGASCRFPGAMNLDEFWSNLAAGVDSVVEVPKERWDPDDYYDADPTKPGKVSAKWLGAMSDIDKFDAQFFGIAPAEAQCMDPQQRLFLQEAWQSLEDAGYCRSTLNGRKVGTYVGVIGSEYGALMFQSPHYSHNPHTMTGNSNAIFAARLAYFLNLKGPAMAIDTACSSSLVAMHIACSALTGGEIDMAVVGGVSLYLCVTGFIQMSKAGMLSSEGRCFAFDSRADGIVPADGVAVVVLKRLADAIADRDHIYGCVIGSGINQDGRTNGITAPNLNSQAELLQSVYDRCAIDPATISYAEAHGTGTRLGDPIEIQALTRAFRKYTDKMRYCAIGSVKSNIGHASAAAGLAGVMKVILSLQHKQLPPAINYRQASEYIDLEASPFYVNTKLSRWDVEATLRRRAAVSSFGFSGTNAHVVIEEFAASEVGAGAGAGDFPSSLLVPLSARTPAALRARAEQLLAHLVRCAGERVSSEKEAIELGNVAYTLQVGREPMKYRMALIVTGSVDVRHKLSAYIAGENHIEGCFRGHVADGEESAASYLSGSQKFRRAIHELLGEAKLAELAELWCKGVELNWDLLTRGVVPRRVSLPTYPFETKSFWLDKSLMASGEPLRSSLQQAETQVPGNDSRARNGAERNSQAVSRRVVLDDIADLAERGGTAPATGTDIGKPQLAIVPRLRTQDAPKAERGIAGISQILTRQLAAVLCIEEAELGMNQKFLDMGLDSILGVEWLREINRVFAVDIAAPRLYDNPTIATLAKFIQGELSLPSAGYQNEGQAPCPDVKGDVFSAGGLSRMLDSLAEGEISLESAVEVFESRSGRESA